MTGRLAKFLGRVLGHANRNVFGDQDKDDDVDEDNDEDIFRQSFMRPPCEGDRDYDEYSE